MLDQDLINNLNRSINTKEIAAVIKSLPIKKSPGPDSLQQYSTSHSKEDQIPILLKLLQIIEMEGALPNSFN